MQAGVLPLQLQCLELALVNLKLVGQQLLLQVAVVKIL